MIQNGSPTHKKLFIEFLLTYDYVWFMRYRLRCQRNNFFSITILDFVWYVNRDLEFYTQTKRFYSNSIQFQLNLFMNLLSMKTFIALAHNNYLGGALQRDYCRSNIHHVISLLHSWCNLYDDDELGDRLRVKLRVNFWVQ